MSSPSDKKQKTIPENREVFSTLPNPIQAHIFSFAIKSTIDIARLRLISKNVCKDVIPLIPTSLSSKIIHCCYQEGEETFVDQLLGYKDLLFEEGHYALGDRLNEIRSPLKNIDIFPGCTVISTLFLDVDPFLGINNEVFFLSKKKGTIKELRDVCTRIHQSTSTTELLEHQQKALLMDAFHPTNLNLKDKDISPHVDNCIQSTLMYLDVPDNVMKKIERIDDKTILLESKSKLEGNDYEYEGEPTALRNGKKYYGHIQENGQIHVLINLVLSYEFVFQYYDQSISSMFFSGLYDENFSQHIKEGVAIVDGIVPDMLRQKLNHGINNLVENNIVDYHPHSRKVVRDLVHPALYSYVKDVTPLVKDVANTSPCKFISTDSDSSSTASSGKDYWGRKYEDSKYQWLPTYFDVSNDGRCQILDYINNLVPRSKYSNLYHALEELFHQVLPFFEVVYSYVRNVKSVLPDDDDIWYDNYDTKALKSNRFTSLRGQQLQIITKIVDYELSSSSSEKSYEGVWHVEGMSHEEIVATGLYILDRDDDIQGGSLLFQRTFQQQEREEICTMVPQDRHPCFQAVVDKGLVPLGTVETLNGRLIVFPNSHVHKVSAMNKVFAHCEGGKKNHGDGVSRRRIVVFFLVNPEKRIISTREVAPQQQEAGGTMTRDEALSHRLQLMKERKYAKQDWNVREIELCEH